MNNIEWLNHPVKEVASIAIKHAIDRQNSLTKPPGSLGVLEEVAIRLSAMRYSRSKENDRPVVDAVKVVVFAADHGIAEEGVSAFPQAVTAEMVKNFSAGGAAISVLANEISAELEVVNVGTVAVLDEMPGVIDQRIAPGTENFYQQKAMSETQLAEALWAGYESVERAQPASLSNGGEAALDLFIAGDMGIANTSSATAIACALLECSAKDITGPGTGLDEAGLNHKIEIIQHSLDRHQLKPDESLQILQALGGFEISAMTGAYIACAQKAIPVLVDGFISSVAALAAIKINPAVKDWLIFSHASAEPGHKIIMQAIQAEPLLDLNMRLGEASGAAVAVPLMRLACALHNKMATFSQAGVSNKE